jgi:hypothetical protein
MNEKNAIERLILEMRWREGASKETEISEMKEDTSNDFLEF